MWRLLFTNGAMLAGLAALAIPVLIHLLLRRRRQRLRFSTLQFFQRQDEQSSQRRKLRNLLLLAVRLLLLALLVLAFARPFLPRSESAAAARPARQVVFVVDRSLSLRALAGGAPRWERLKARLRQALGELAEGDQAALVSCAAHSEVVCPPGPPAAALRALNQLEPTTGVSDLGEGMRAALKLLAGSAPNALPSICVASDLQVGACKNLAAQSVPREVAVQVLNVGDLITPNLAVTELRLGGAGPDKPHVILANFSDEEEKPAKITLTLDGKEILTQSLVVKTGALERVELALPTLAAGWHQAELKLEAEDALAADNTRWETFFVPPSVRVWVAETRVGKRIFEEESYFILSALDPAAGDTNGPRSGFNAEKVAPEALVKKLAPTSTNAACDVVILPGLKSIPPGLAGALAEFARRGGGVLLYLGDDVDPGVYNRELRDLLPATLGHLERNTAESFALKWHLDDYDLNAPMFAAFRAPESGNLWLAEFHRRFTLTPASEAALVSARFDDGVPVMVSQALGRGRIVLANTSVDTRWTDWPKHKTFVPWLHQTCRQLGQAAGNMTAKPAARLVVAEDAEVDLGVPARQKSVRVRAPGGQTREMTADAGGRLTQVNVNTPGIYTIQDRDGRELQRLVVNLPAEESDLTALKAVEFPQRLTRVEEPLHSKADAGLFGANQQQKELWRLLLLAALGLMLGEVLIANRTFA